VRSIYNFIITPLKERYENEVEIEDKKLKRLSNTRK